MTENPRTWDELGIDRALGHLDPAVIERGRVLARSGSLQVLASGDRRIRAVCPGSDREVFLVTLDLVDEAHHGVTIDCICTCGAEELCDHGAAAIINAFERHRAPTADPAHRRHERDWRDLLTAGDEPPLARPPLALQFALDRPRPSATVPDPVPRLTLRPLRRGRSDRWVRTGADWTDLLDPGADFQPDQLAALQALTISTKGAVRADRALSTVRASPSIWGHLDLAQRAGVVFVDQRGEPTVRLAPEPARPRVELATDADGRIRVDLQFLTGSDTALPSTAITLGRPIHGLAHLTGDELELVRLEQPLDTTLTTIATESIRLPVHDLDEFLEQHRPTILRRARIVSPDGSVATTTADFETLVCRIERTELSRATVRWFARYRQGGRPIDHPLHDPLGANRDPGAEEKALAELDPPTLGADQLVGIDDRPRSAHIGGLDLVTLLDDVVAELRRRGALVEIVGDQPALRRADGDPLIGLAVTRSDRGADGNDWFDLDVTITLNGELVDFPVLFAALHEGSDALFLPSGTWLPLDSPRLQRLRELIDEARSLSEAEPGHTARVSRHQLGWWEDLDDIVSDERATAWRTAVGRLGPLSRPVSIDPPPDLAADLRPYQRDGLDWLVFLHEHDLGGILADDMGLGKTIQALALCLHVQQIRPDTRFLVVAPTSVVENWAREARQFAPTLQVRTITATETRRGSPLADEVADADLVITSYALLRLEADAYADLDWEILLLDEAQFVKNPRGATHRVVHDLPIATKIAITGTPLENTLMDLWALLSITAPGLFPDRDGFDAVFRKPIEAGDAPGRLDLLQRRIAPLIRRRTKAEVLTDLPPKIEQRIDIELDPRHARIYQRQLQRQRQRVLGLVGDIDQHRFEILRSLTILRLLALDPALVDPADDGITAAKVERLVADLHQIGAEGHRALVFSQFTRFLDRIRDRLDQAGIAHSHLDGRTRDRDAAISAFKDGDIPVFLISLKAGGFGLNLTEADYCFVLDPWWNPAAETQAVDRTHRIGQQNAVHVYRYVSVGTIEEKVMDLKAGKAALFDRVVDGDGARSETLGADDIRGLLDLDG